MSLVLRKLKKGIQAVKERCANFIGRDKQRKFNGKTLLQYRGDIEGYCKYVLKGIVLTPDQLKLIQKFDSGKRRVFCRAGHVVGKSFLSAILVSYLYDTYDQCIIITTAPRLDSVRDILWRELRGIRRRAGLGGFTGPRSLRMQDSEYHYAIGTTARDHTAFQGKHGVRVFIIIDEAVGVESEFWEAIDTMLSGDEFGLLAIYNPTTTACQAYKEESAEGTYVHTISSLDHPNIKAELKGLKPPYPAAVRLETIRTWIKKWCDELHPTEKEDASKGDFIFPPLDISDDECRKVGITRKRYRPGPIAMARIIGRWPLTAINTFWSESLLVKCRANRQEIKANWRTVLGCDVARFGDDMTEIFVRRGICAVHHEAHNGWDGKQVAGRLKQLALQYKGPQEAKDVSIYIDETGGWGSSVIDHKGTGEVEYNFIGISSSWKASDKTLHKNVRCELWARTIDLGKEGLMDLSRLPQEDFDELKRQLLAQKYIILPSGVLAAEDKDAVKDILGRSPDGADALNLCYLPVGFSRAPD